MNFEDSYLDSSYEDRFESYDYDPNGYDAHDGHGDYWGDEDDDYGRYDRDVDDDFPMSLEYDGPFGLSGYDEY